MALLEFENLRIAFPVGGRMAEAVRGVSFAVESGEVVGLLGESGSGKSLSALAALRLVPPPGRIVGGAIRLAGRDLLSLNGEEMRAVRGHELSMVFQDPLSALNPSLSIGRQLLHVIRTHMELTHVRARQLALELLDLVGFPDPARIMGSYPHELSGGMRQRALIGMAIACRPKLLIADEPTTALDVTIQAQIIDLFRRLRRELGFTLLFITHNLDLMAELVDRAIVMYAGTVVEADAVEGLFAKPRHPYTRMLIECVPRIDGRVRQLRAIPGMPPSIGPIAPGCPFEPRCPLAHERCRDERPALRGDVSFGVACWVTGQP